MKPVLVQQRSNGTLWWVVDQKISIRARPPWPRGKKMHRVWTLIPADGSHRGSRIDRAEYYTFLSN